MGAENMWMEEARGLAAQCWCDPETENRIMDVVLCEAIARRIANWMETAAQNQGNTDYYRGLLVQCGEAIGDKAYIADDGSRAKDVLCAKIPELVKSLLYAASLRPSCVAQKQREHMIWTCKYCGDNEKPKCPKCTREDGKLVTDELVEE